MPQPIATNTLFYGDNLTILREYVNDESVDLIYLDPPFNSSRSYNVLFKDESGREAEAQIEAFDDSWHWGESAEKTYQQLVTNSAERAATMIGALRQFIGTNQMMAYLVMMAARLVELHRVLKPTGSLYLHCDPTASHYLKIILDSIFDPQNFRNEIAWKRSSAHSDTKQGMQRYGRIRDILLFYTKTTEYIWNPQYLPYTTEYLDSEYRHIATDGRNYKETDLTAAKPGGDTEYEWHVKRLKRRDSRWQADLEEEYRNPNLDWEYRSVKPYKGRYWAFSKENLIEFARAGKLIHRETGMPRLMHFADKMPGITLQDLWTDIPPAIGNENLGYPTQKPLALLERIINASSNAGDIVLDPFCGCGTAVAAAQKLGRKWVGIDITHLSIALQKNRLKDMFDLKPCVDYNIIGEPEDVGSAQQLAQENRYQFQFWALSLVQARPSGSPSPLRRGERGEVKKGADRGIDGVISFIDDATEKPKRILVQVKSGHVKSGDIRDLRGTVEREQAAMGFFITLEPPTREMEKEAVTAGSYHAPLWKRDFPKLQILTITDLLNGIEPKMPSTRVTFKQAQRAEPNDAKQAELGL